MKKLESGAVSIGVILTGAAMLGSVFVWTYSQFTAVNTHASETDVKVAAVVQQVSDVDARLTRIENKQDDIIKLLKN